MSTAGLKVRSRAVSREEGAEGWRRAQTKRRQLAGHRSQEGEGRHEHSHPPEVHGIPQRVGPIVRQERALTLICTDCPPSPTLRRIPVDGNCPAMGFRDSAPSGVNVRYRLGPSWRGPARETPSSSLRARARTRNRKVGGHPTPPTCSSGRGLAPGRTSRGPAAKAGCCAASLALDSVRGELPFLPEGASGRVRVLPFLRGTSWRCCRAGAAKDGDGRLLRRHRLDGDGRVG